MAVRLSGGKKGGGFDISEAAMGKNVEETRIADVGFSQERQTYYTLLGLARLYLIGLQCSKKNP